MVNLIIPVGMPGCGKTTLSKSLLDLKYSKISTDEIRRNIFGSLVAAHANEDPAIKDDNNQKVFDIFHRQIGENLRYGVDTYADATNLSRPSREYLKNIADECGAAAHVILFKNPDEAIWRNSRRPDDDCVPKDVMLDFYAKYLEMLRDIRQEEYASVTEIASIR